MSALGQHCHDGLDLQEKLERRRLLVESQGASFESTPSERIADEGSVLATAERAARLLVESQGASFESTPSERIADEGSALAMTERAARTSDVANVKRRLSMAETGDGGEGSQDVVCPTRHRLAGGDFRCAPLSFWNALHAQFAPSREGDAGHDEAAANAILVCDASDKLSAETCGGSEYSPPATPGSFTIVLDKSDGDRLGLELESDDGITWVIEEVSGGLAAVWNTTHPNEEVRAGDRLIEVNGVRDTAGLIAECKVTQLLKLQ